jgi:AcrR family transcriptional regulator
VKILAKRSETMQENRAKLIKAARKAFAEEGFSAASMDELTASVGLTRGAIYPNFGDKKGLLAAVVAEMDGEMAARAYAAGQKEADPWAALMAEGRAYIEMALEREVQRIVLRDGPAVLGDHSTWPSQNCCLQRTIAVVAKLIDDGVIKPLDVEVTARLISGAAMNTALWVGASDNPRESFPKAIEAFETLCSGLRVKA